MKTMVWLGTVAAGVTLALQPLPAFAAPSRLVASLTGAQETAGGAEKGSGEFAGELGSVSGDLCYTLEVKGIGKPTAAHIHAGAAGTDGAPVATIEVTGDDGELCLAINIETAKAIAADPSAYYVNVHTADFPAGAVRGQLSQ